MLYLKTPNQKMMVVKLSLRLLAKLGKDSRVDAQREAVVELQLEEEEVTIEVEEEEAVKTAAKMEVRAVAVDVEETEKEAVDVEEAASMVVQEEAVEAVVAVKETKVLKMVKEPLLTPLKLVDSEKDMEEKLVKNIIQWTVNQELAAEREIRLKEAPVKVTGVTIKQKLKLVKKKKKRR